MTNATPVTSPALPRVLWRDRTRPALEVEVGTVYHHLVEVDGAIIRLKKVAKEEMRDYSDVYLSGTLQPTVLSVAASFCLRGLPITEKAFTKVKGIISMATANLSQLGEGALNDLCSILRSRLPENHELKTALIPTVKAFQIKFAKQLREAILANVVEEQRTGDAALTDALEVSGQDPASKEDHRESTAAAKATEEALAKVMAAVVLPFSPEQIAEQAKKAARKAKRKDIDDLLTLPVEEVLKLKETPEFKKQREMLAANENAFIEAERAIEEAKAKAKEEAPKKTATPPAKGKTVVKKSTSVPPKREKAAPQRFKCEGSKEMTLRADSERRKVYDTLKAMQGKTGSFPNEVATKSGLKEANVIGALRYLVLKGWVKPQSAN